MQLNIRFGHCFDNGRSQVVKTLGKGKWEELLEN